MDAFDPRSGVLLKADCFSGVDDGNLPFILVSVFFLQKPDHESYAILIRLIADNFGPISKRQLKVPETDSKKKAHGRHSEFPSGWIPSWKKQKESPIGHELLEGSQEKPASQLGKSRFLGNWD